MKKTAAVGVIAAAVLAAELRSPGKLKIFAVYELSIERKSVFTVLLVETSRVFICPSAAPGTAL